MITHVSKKVMIFFIVLLFSLSISGCSQNSDISETVDHIASENTTGYYFDVYSNESKNNTRNGVIEVLSFEDALYFEIENSGQERQFSVHVFLDYQQIPFSIDGTEYTTYLVNAAPQTSLTHEFYLANAIDTKYNHSLLVILTAGSDILTNKKTEIEMTDQYSIALNHVLSLNKTLPLFNANYEPEDSTIIEEQSTGLLLNSDTKFKSRTIPEREMHVNKNENFSLQYQVGGYSGSDEVAVIITIGLNQAQINEQNYILCSTKNGSLVQGIANLNAPEKAGEYEIMGWVIKNPYSIEKNEFIPLDAAYRFTLVVK